MEPRKITVFETRGQKTSTFLSSATTLAELKADLDANGINYTDMVFYEGTSKTEIKTDSSILPHDVPYKGTVTNELVFMLTNTNKKIKSGMDRKELYAEIKNRKLQEECLKRFGKNFTMCKTVDLESIVNECCKTKKEEDKCTKVDEGTKKVVTESSKEVKETKENKEESITNVVNAIKKLVDTLYDLDYINDHEKNGVLKHLKSFNTSSNSTKCNSSYSEDEINEMFSELL